MLVWLILISAEAIIKLWHLKTFHIETELTHLLHINKYLDVCWIIDTIICFFKLKSYHETQNKYMSLLRLVSYLNSDLGKYVSFSLASASVCSLPVFVKYCTFRLSALILEIATLSWQMTSRHKLILQKEWIAYLANYAYCKTSSSSSPYALLCI